MSHLVEPPFPRSNIPLSCIRSIGGPHSSRGGFTPKSLDGMRMNHPGPPPHHSQCDSRIFILAQTPTKSASRPVCRGPKRETVSPLPSHSIRSIILHGEYTPVRRMLYAVLVADSLNSLTCQAPRRHAGYPWNRVSLSPRLPFLMAKILAGTPLTAPLVLVENTFLPSNVFHVSADSLSTSGRDGGRMANTKFRPEVYSPYSSALSCSSRKPLPRRSFSPISDFQAIRFCLSYLNGWTTASAPWSNTVSLHCRYNLGLALVHWHILCVLGRPRLPIINCQIQNFIGSFHG